MCGLASGVEGGAPKGGLRVMYSNRSGFYLMLPQPKGDAGARSMQPLPRYVQAVGQLTWPAHWQRHKLAVPLKHAAHCCGTFKSYQGGIGKG